MRPYTIHCRCPTLHAVNPSAASNAARLPLTPVEMITQAKESINETSQRGSLLQKIQFLLPINEKKYDFLAIEAVDYPCSLRDEFESCCSLTKALLQQMTSQTEFTERRLDDGGVEGEPCSAIFPSSKEIIAVVYPTADRLPELRSLAKEKDRPLLIINPQWNESGQVISDFGFGPWKKAADEFLKQFEESYFLKEQRVGSPGSVDPITGQLYVNGSVVRILLSTPRDYKVFVMSPDGSNQLVGGADHQPSYPELESMLLDGRKENLEIFEIAQRASVSGVVKSGLESGEGSGEDVVTEFEVDSMDAATLRRFLGKRGLPTSGRIVKLKERLKNAIQKETS